MYSGFVFIILRFFLEVTPTVRPSLDSDLASLSCTGHLIAQLEDRSIKVIMFEPLGEVHVPLGDSLRSNGGALSSLAEDIAFQQILPSRTTNAGETTYDRVLSIVEADGSNLRQFFQVKEPTHFCWSPDRMRLAFVSTAPSDNAGRAQRWLHVLDLKSGRITPVERAATISLQCWNVDASALVFEKHGSLFVFYIGPGKIAPLTIGAHATWSPDGSSIAYLRDGTYYAVQPSDSHGKPLFKKKNALTALWWSPDSRYVAYVLQPRWWQTSTQIPDELHLRVRRLSDGAEKILYRFSGKGRPLTFQWIKSPALLHRARQLIPSRNRA